MDCNETRLLLEADLDGELDLASHLALQRHLQECPACTELAANARARRTAVRQALPRFTAPRSLAGKIRSSLAPADAAAAAVAPISAAPAASSKPSSRAVIIFPLWQAVGLAASIAVAVSVGFSWGNHRAQTNLLVDEGVADHIRSLAATHLTDVASTDQHTVKPWFAGKLDFSPPVVDLASAGFPLTGGRLEHLDGRPAAALVFHRRQHAINVLIWPAGVTAIPAHPTERNGYNVQAWTKSGMNFLAISEIPASELAHFAELFRASAP